MADIKALTAALTLATALVLPAAALAQQAQGYTLQGRIFDFSASHPDFERSSTGLVTGQVAPQLGPDGRMIWSGQDSPVFSTKENFDQWYRDVPGVNASRPIDISLTYDPNSGLYIYENERFFPIDNELLGNEGDLYKDSDGNPRNFHFATHLAGAFSFSTDSDSFSFTGDDDLWVFFDGKLGIDLGGTHPPASATIDGAALRQLGLEPGQTYRLDVFHAERHTDGSNFRIQTNFDISAPPSRELPAEPGDILDEDGHKIVAMPTGEACLAGFGTPAELMAMDGSGAKFMAIYCLNRPEAASLMVGTGDTPAEAQLAGLTSCFEEEGDIAGSDGVSACTYFGLAERVVSEAPGAMVSPGQALLPGKSYRSASGAHYLISGNGSDLSIRETGSDVVVWSLQLVDRSADRIEMTGRGTLAMLDRDGAVIWETAIASPVPGSVLEIDPTGVAQILSPAGEALWRSDVIPETVTPGLSYEIRLRAASNYELDSGDGGRSYVSTRGLILHAVTFVPPVAPELTEGVIPFGPNGELPFVDEDDTPALADMPEVAVLLTYSINDQVRGAADTAPDYFVAVDNAGEGVITEGEGSALVVLREGDRVVFQIADGQFKDQVLIGEDNRAVFGSFGEGAFFIIRPPLEPTDGNFASFESELFPGQYLRHSGFRLRLDEAGPDSASLLRRDATFRIEPAGDAASLSCFDAVQGRIAWDYAGSTGWNDANITKLCGTVASTEPARCFAQVMHEGVEWAPGQAQWNWNNAQALCEATTDAAARIGCFQERMPQAGWEQAISACRAVAMGGQ